MAEGIRVLHTDDDAAFRELTETYVQRESERIEVEPVPGPRAGLERLDGDVECIVSDYEMPGTDGIEFLEAVRERRPSLPFILFTGKGSEELASEAISAGVTDYLQKKGRSEQFELLVNRIENAVEAYRSERQLAERTRRLETLIDNLPGIVYRARNERGWPIENLEGEVEQLTGYRAESIEGGAVSWEDEVLHPGDRDRVWEEVQKALEDRGSFEVTYRIVTNRGETRWMWERGQTIPGVGDDSETLEGFITDITDRRERQQELEQYEELINTVEDGVFVVNGQKEIEAVNEPAARATGLDSAEIEGQTVGEFTERFAVDPDEVDRFVSTLSSVLSGDATGGQTQELELDLPIGDQTVEYQFTPFQTGDERKVAIVGRNVTDRKERERELRRTNERLETFASFLSHDLRNPLQIAKTRLDLAERECGSEHHRDIKSALDRMERLIDDVLALAREQEADPTTVRLAAAVGRCWDRVDADGVSVRVASDASIRADPKLLDQLLVNLMQNAVEHGQSGERSAGEELTIEVGTDGAGFYIEDDGAGLPPASDRLFETGFTTKGEGTGLGLAIVRQVADAHGWTVAATEGTAGGARFVVSGVEVTGAEDGD
jgi:PAS domain S-box-containing protein